jgi:serine O-acetyltransferase
VSINDPQAEWSLDHIVAELRVSRGKVRDGRRPNGEIVEMPSRDALSEIMAGLFAALFPTHFGLSDFTDEGIDYFVGHKLDATLRMLVRQVDRELRFSTSMAKTERSQHAFEVTRSLAARLPRVRALLESDIHAAYQGDPAARSIEEVRFCYPGITAMTHHRIAHELYLLGLPLLGRMIAELAHSSTGIDIHPGAEIGDSFFIDHGTGVVIGETTQIGCRVRLYQAVTLGAKRFPLAEDGSLIKGRPRHPVVEDDVVIYAGATILGRVRIGRGSIIGGNVWLTRDVAPGSNVTQALARSDSFDQADGI